MNVRAIDNQQPRDSVSYLAEVIGNNRAEAIIVIVQDKKGNFEVKHFGEFSTFSQAAAGFSLQMNAYKSSHVEGCDSR